MNSPKGGRQSPQQRKNTKYHNTNENISDSNRITLDTFSSFMSVIYHRLDNLEGVSTQTKYAKNIDKSQQIKLNEPNFYITQEIFFGFINTVLNRLDRLELTKQCTIDAERDIYG